ncbi:DUF4349 domain-containing protein [Georgenia sp. MJ170]|uniref:DUF4349 domain-containing protein n=1 Tax=Georgenia sunbinii TaxID=3117728 RepID=UPI002F2660FB
MRSLRQVLLLVLVALGLVACSGGASDSGGADPQMSSAEDAGADGDSAESGAQAAADNREVITTGSLTIVVADPVDAVDDVVELLTAADGRVEERSQRTATEQRPASAHLTLRVPSGALNALITDLEQVGEVSDVSISAQDVTREGQDLDARITALQASTERLLGLMVEADTSEALLAAESALSERQGELESLQSQRSALSDQVAMSTLQVSLVEEKEAAQLETDGFLGGLQDGWRALVGFASGLLVVVGTLLPWLVLVGVPLAVVVLVRRARRRPAAQPTPAGEDVTPA